MAVKKTSRVRLDEFVSEICPDPSKCEPMVVLAGFVGRGEDEDKIRGYADSGLSWWYEVTEADVVYSKPIENSSLGGSYLWVRSDAKLRSGAAKPSGEFAAQAVPRAVATGLFNPYLAEIPVTDPSICIDPSTNCPPFTSPPICIDPVASWRSRAARAGGVPITDPSICIDPSTNCPPFTSPPICINPVVGWRGGYDFRVGRAGSVPITDPSICIDTNPPGCVPITDPKICVDPVAGWRNYWGWR